MKQSTATKNSELKSPQPSPFKPLSTPKSIEKTQKTFKKVKISVKIEPKKDLLKSGPKPRPDLTCEPIKDEIKPTETTRIVTKSLQTTTSIKTSPVQVEKSIENKKQAKKKEILKPEKKEILKGKNEILKTQEIRQIETNTNTISGSQPRDLPRLEHAIYPWNNMLNLGNFLNDPLNNPVVYVPIFNPAYLASIPQQSIPQSIPQSISSSKFTSSPRKQRLFQTKPSK
jgi:hypothetical protein